MQEHPSSEQLNQYQRRRLAPDVFLSIQRHIDSCNECSEHAGKSPKQEDYEVLVAALTPDSSEEPYHLAQSQMISYVSGQLDEVDIEAADSHLTVCSQCQQAIDELQSIQTVAKQKQLHWIFVGAWPRSLQVAAALLVVFGLVVLALVLLRPREETTKTRKSPSLPQQAPSNEQRATSPDNHPNTEAGTETQPEDSELAKLSPPLRLAITTALRNRSLERPQVLSDLKGTPGTLLGDSSNGLPFRLLSPVGQAVQSTNPMLRWQKVEGASGYSVTIGDSKLNEVASSKTIVTNEWKVPISLKRGGIYSWQVTAFKGDERIVSPVLPAAPAKFNVLDQASDEELRAGLKLVKENHLASGVLYARVGLLDDAEREFQAHLKAKPHSATAQALLQSVQAMKK